MKEDKKMPLIQDLEIKISGDSAVPHIILNGVDFKEQDIGLIGLVIDWGGDKTDPSIGENTVKIDFIHNRENPQISSISQSFVNGLLRQ